MSQAAVEITLDLTEYNEKIQRPKDFLAFWKKLCPVFETGAKINQGESKTVENEKGKVKINFINIPHHLSLISKDTPFAIHSVLQRPEIIYKCSSCLNIERKEKYGPFKCFSCDNRMCDEHAVILDGKMRAYCHEHLPKCKGSNQPATFWCDGPKCRGEIAWSEKYRTFHPNNKNHWYCPDCYTAVFPKCNHLNCDITGINSCEYILSNKGENCNKRLCNKHVKRWQIYGPHKKGLSLCIDHARINNLSLETIIFQVVLATAKRNINKKQKFKEQRLPSLGSIKHILIKGLGIQKDLQTIYNGILIFKSALQHDNLSRQIIIDIDRVSEIWNKELKNSKEHDETGMKIFEVLKSYLINSRQDDIAAVIRYSDYRANKKILFIRVDESKRGFLIGKQGQNIKKINEYLGVTIQFESTKE